MRAGPSSATGYSPVEMMLGRKPVLPVDVDLQNFDLKGKLFLLPNFCFFLRDRMYKGACGLAPRTPKANFPTQQGEH